MAVMIEGDSLRAIQDATIIAFYGEDFEASSLDDGPIQCGPDSIVQAATRTRTAYDPNAACMVEVTEMHMLMHNHKQGTVHPEHRVAALWDNGDMHEIDITSGEVLEEYSEADYTKDKIIRALSAASGII